MIISVAKISNNLYTIGAQVMLKIIDKKNKTHKRFLYKLQFCLRYTYVISKMNTSY